jgi:hypothetical protein
MQPKKSNAALNADLRMLTHAASLVTGQWWLRMTARELVETTRVLSWADHFAGLQS